MREVVSLVTGGAGFIGSHLVDLLIAEGHTVRVIDNLSGGRESNLAHHHGNRLSCEWLDINQLTPENGIFKDVAHCFHLAGISDVVPSIEQPTRYLQTNLLGTVNVLEAARSAGVGRIVYAASSSCYGEAATPTSEDAPIRPPHPYALSKYQGEQAAFHWHRIYGMGINSICIFNAFGLRARTTGSYGSVIGVFLKQKLAGKPFTIVGDGTQARDFVHVTDVARAFFAAATAPVSGERFNIGSGKPQSVNRLAELLYGPVHFIAKRHGEPQITCADSSKARRLLGWQPRVTFEDGIAEILAAIEQWQDGPLWDASSIAHASEEWHRYLHAGSLAGQ